MSGVPGHGHPHQAVPGDHGEELLLAPARGPGGPRRQHQVPGAREVTCHVSIVTNRASNKTLQFWLANSIVSYSSPSLTLYDLCAGELIVSIYHGSGS